MSPSRPFLPVLYRRPYVAISSRQHPRCGGIHPPLRRSYLVTSCFRPLLRQSAVENRQFARTGERVRAKTIGGTKEAISNQPSEAS